MYYACKGNAEYHIDYEEQIGTTLMPGTKQVMRRVSMIDGETTYYTEYTYSDGYYDREKKESYGFGKVISSFSEVTLGTKVVEYYNRDYHSKGIARSTQILGINEMGDTVVYSTETVEVSEAPYAQIKSKTTIQTESVNPAELETIERSVAYGYDNWRAV